MYSRLALLPHPAGARRMYQMDKVMLKLGPGGESYVPAPGLFPGGGDRSAWFIEKDGEKIGNFFLIREGRFLQSARLTGLTLHEPADVQNLLGPDAHRIEAQNEYSWRVEALKASTTTTCTSRSPTVSTERSMHFNQVGNNIYADPRAIRDHVVAIDDRVRELRCGLREACAFWSGASGRPSCLHQKPSDASVARRASYSCKQKNPAAGESTSNCGYDLLQVACTKKR